MFRLVDAKWGPQAIDRFASYYNSLLPRFSSKFASPGCTGVDALVQDWSGEGYRVCPPVGLVVNAVQSSYGLFWSWENGHGPSFGLFYCDGPSRFESFVREVFVPPAKHDLILEGRDQMQIYKSHPSVFRSCSKFRMLALRVDFG